MTGCAEHGRCSPCLPCRVRGWGEQYQLRLDEYESPATAEAWDARAAAALDNWTRTTPRIRLVSWTGRPLVKA